MYLDDDKKLVSSKVGLKTYWKEVLDPNQNPFILMGDEPTGNLDNNNSENVFQIFIQLKEGQGLSLLVVTHGSDYRNGR